MEIFLLKCVLLKHTDENKQKKMPTAVKSSQQFK